MRIGAAGFISPHIDDAVFSCATKIGPGSVVVTVFSGGPKSVDPLPLWDRECGVFQPGDDVPGVRAREDDAALAQLQATGLRLEFWDSQYVLASMSSAARLRRRIAHAIGGERVQRRLCIAVTERLAKVIGELDFDTWIAPFGIHHPDHILINEAVLRLLPEFGHIRWVLYEDLPYARERPAALEVARQRIESLGFSLQSLPPTGAVDSTAKKAAVQQYRSQLIGLGERMDLVMSGPEAYHLLSPGPRRS